MCVIISNQNVCPSTYFYIRTKPVYICVPKQVIYCINVVYEFSICLCINDFLFPEHSPVTGLVTKKKERIIEVKLNVNKISLIYDRHICYSHKYPE